MRFRQGAMVLAACLALAACKDKKQDNLQREQQQYNVVQEGSANGVTGTLNAPGETATTTDTTTAYQGMTATNADTTTAFTLPGAAPGSAPTSTQPGSLGSTLPSSSTGNFGSYQQPPPRRTAPRRVEQQPRTDTSTTEQHASRSPEQPPRTDTTSTTEGPPQTQTDTRGNQPAPQPQTPPPPPPTTTDTRGPTDGLKPVATTVVVTGFSPSHM